MEKDRVLLVLRDADQPLSTNAVADQLGVDWHTAKKWLETLVDGNAIHRSTVSNRLTLYWDHEIPF